MIAILSEPTKVVPDVSKPVEEEKQKPGFMKKIDTTAHKVLDSGSAAIEDFGGIVKRSLSSVMANGKAIMHPSKSTKPSAADDKGGSGAPEKTPKTSTHTDALPGTPVMKVAPTTNQGVI